MKKVIELVPAPKAVSDLAKMITAIQDLAKMNKAYYDSLIESGFTKDQAFNLVKDHKWF